MSEYCVLGQRTTKAPVNYNLSWSLNWKKLKNLFEEQHQWIHLVLVMKGCINTDLFFFYSVEQYREVLPVEISIFYLCRVRATKLQ